MGEAVGHLEPKAEVINCCEDGQNSQSFDALRRKSRAWFVATFNGAHLAQKRPLVMTRMMNKTQSLEGI